jgi:hypothetical protein
LDEGVWIISVYFKIRNTLPKSGTFLLGHPVYIYILCVSGSSVSIETGYGMDGPGIESPWGRDFPHLSRPALGPTQPPEKWESGRDVTLTHHPFLVLRFKNGIELYLYSP